LDQFNRKVPSFIPKIRTASRTDIGVHALMNACTFDTTDNSDRKDYEIDIIYKGLNYYLQKYNHQIQINEIYQTKDNRFDCRGAP
jgi:tRNA U38,U39,U40 pseudouridine synthase TruA